MSLADAVKAARGEVALLLQASGDVAPERAESALDRAGLRLVFVDAAKVGEEPRPVVKVRFELRHAASGESKTLDTYVAGPRSELDDATTDRLRDEARRRAVVQLVGDGGLDGSRSAQPTVELPEIPD